jgi:hypothetical protein
MSTPDTECPIPLSNSFRLTGRQWLIVASIAMVLVAFASPLWKNYERFEPDADYRIPHELGNDYWLYSRFADLAADRYGAFLLGDSVVWGEYVTRSQTLSHYLTEQAGSTRFANLGLDGAHPLALAGLVEHYAGAIANKKVIVQCNPLWMSSPRADLQDPKGEFNHPRLIPQFIPEVPAYHDEISPRLGVLVEQRVAFDQWTSHLQQAYYDRTDIPSWTLEHPYDCPLLPATKGLPSADDALRHVPQPWYKNKIAKQDYPWIDLDKSLQWQAFRRIVKLLERRGNRVCVLVGPFNEHLLTPKSSERYREVKERIRGWLKENGVPHVIPEPLSSELYGDASHPLSAGYAALARELLAASNLWEPH